MIIINWLLAISPIALVLVLMTGFQWSGVRAGAAGWIAASIIAWAAFGAGPDLLLHAQTKGALLTLYVLYIVWAALLLYFVVEETGAFRVIGAMIERLTSDKPLQLLIIGWVFGTFLQGVAGFGVPIAVVAPLLLGLGFSPLISVAAPAIGHSWAVTFGNMATSYEAMLAVTGIDGTLLTHWSALLLGITGYLCGAGVVAVYGGWRAVRATLLPLLIIGTAMAGVQYAMATAGIWTLGGLGAGIAGILISIPVARLTRKAGGRTVPDGKAGPKPAGDMGLFWALAA